jgi:hypothetical protein
MAAVLAPHCARMQDGGLTPPLARSRNADADELPLRQTSRGLRSRDLPFQDAVEIVLAGD